MNDQENGQAIIPPPPRRRKNTRYFFFAIVGVILLAFGYFVYELSQTISDQTNQDIANSVVNDIQNRNALNANAGTTQVDTAVTDDDPFFGSRDASVVIVEFGDFQCPYCKEVHPVVKSLQQRYGDRIFFQFRDFPIESSHPEATNAALAAGCALEQGTEAFWNYHDRLYQFQDDLGSDLYPILAERIGLNIAAFNSCLSDQTYFDEVEEDYTEGIDLGVRSTPTFFINGSRVPGAIPEATFFSIIDRLLSQTTE